MKGILSFILLACLSTITNAEFFVEGGMRTGGDKLSSGGSGGNRICIEFCESLICQTKCPSNDNHRVASGGHLAVGYHYFLEDDKSRALTCVLGFVKGGNFDESSSASLLEALYTRDYDGNRLGLGLAYHIDPQYEEEIDFDSTITIDFDNSLGVLLKYEIPVSEQVWWVGLRLLLMDYATEGENVNANSVGIYVTRSFD